MTDEPFRLSTLLAIMGILSYIGMMYIAYRFGENSIGGMVSTTLWYGVLLPICIYFLRGIEDDERKKKTKSQEQR